MDEEIKSKLNQILLNTQQRDKAFDDLRKDVNDISNELTAMKTKIDVVLDQKRQVEELVLTVNTLKTQFKIVWAVFALGGVTVGGMILAATFSGLVL